MTVETQCVCDHEHGWNYRCQVHLAPISDARICNHPRNEYDTSPCEICAEKRFLEEQLAWSRSSANRLAGLLKDSMRELENVRRAAKDHVVPSQITNAPELEVMSRSIKPVSKPFDRTRGVVLSPKAELESSLDVLERVVRAGEVQSECPHGFLTEIRHCVRCGSERNKKRLDAIEAAREYLKSYGRKI